LSDAKFFWEQDLKVSLEDQAAKLSQITFHEKLGTVAQRHERFAALAFDFHNEPDEVKVQARKAVMLLKSDLVTGMVGEFPELQGLMGGYYAQAQGATSQTVNAIRDHYKPLGQTDDLPTDPVAVLAALCDKVDALAGFFGVGLKPTGSKDPYALRRAALGVIRLITENGLRVPLNRLFRGAAQLYRNQGIQAADAENDLLDFFADRLKVQQREAGVRHDLIDAVFALGGEDDLVRLLARVNALQAFVATQEGADLLAGYKRAANILKSSGDDKNSVAPAQAGAHNASPLKPTDAIGSSLRWSDGSVLGEAESALLCALNTAEPLAASAIAAEQFEDAMTALASLRAPIDAFFDGVMVNDPDPEKRAFRVGLLTRFRNAVCQVADFSRIEG
jgi:glycyl-tRNA synthetase beta chain